MSEFFWKSFNGLTNYFSLLCYYQQCKIIDNTIGVIDMMKVESSVRKKNWSELWLRIEKEDIVTILIAFALARASIFKGFTPFGFAFFSSYIILRGLSIPLLLSVIIGSISVNGFEGLSYISAYILVYILFILVKEEKSFSLIRAFVATSIVFLFSRSIGLVLGKNIFIYDLIMVFFESIIVFTFSYIFSFSLPIEKMKGTNIGNEKTICSFITLALVLSGMKELSLLGIQLKSITGMVIILLLAYNQGAFFGGITGIVLGMISYISNGEMPFIISIMAVGGLLSGVFRDLGKMGSILGFALGNGIISYYINGLGTSFITYRELLLGSIIFLMIPKKVNEKMSDLFTANYYLKKDYNQKRDELVAKKLNKMMELFDRLSITFKDAAEDEHFSAGEIYGLVDKIANDVCTSCSRYENCWNDNYYRSYQKFFNIIGIAEIKGDNKEAIFSEIDKYCIRPKEILDRVDRAVERLKLNESWKSKLKENRMLLSEQLASFSRLVEDIVVNIYEKPSFNEELEQNIYKELKNNRVDISEVTVVQIGDDDLDIFIDLNKAVATDERIKKIISQTLEAPVLSDNQNTNSKRLRFKLIRHNRYSAVTKIAMASSLDNKVSGDSYTFGEVENTHYVAISDGMGKGYKANRESKIAISLLERLMEANIDKEIILKTINSVLRAKSSEEVFTTLDLGLIDLYTGKLQMIKTGAPATFIKKKDRVEVINSSSLPVGMLQEIDFNIYEEYIEDGDIIIMMSDGVLDSCEDVDNREIWMRDIIMSINSINPETIANEILDRAKSYLSCNKDDMTVLVTKVWKNI